MTVWLITLLCSKSAVGIHYLPLTQPNYSTCNQRLKSGKHAQWFSSMFRQKDTVWSMPSPTAPPQWAFDGPFYNTSSSKQTWFYFIIKFPLPTPSWWARSWRATVCFDCLTYNSTLQSLECNWKSHSYISLLWVRGFSSWFLSHFPASFNVFISYHRYVHNTYLQKMERVFPFYMNANWLIVVNCFGVLDINCFESLDNNWLWALWPGCDSTFVYHIVLFPRRIRIATLNKAVPPIEYQPKQAITDAIHVKQDDLILNLVHPWSSLYGFEPSFFHYSTYLVPRALQHVSIWLVSAGTVSQVM